MDARRLDTIIDEFEEVVEKVKNFSDLAEKLSVMQSKVEELQEQQNKCTMTQVDANLSLEKNLDASTKFTGEMRDAMVNQEKGVENSLEAIHKETRMLLEQINGILKDKISQLDSKYDVLLRDYRKQYKEYEELVRAQSEKLDSNVETSLKAKHTDLKTEVDTKLNHYQNNITQLIGEEQIRLDKKINQLFYISGAMALGIVGIVIILLSR
ncbi:MAG: hypothetical protein SCL54_16570 [Bacillota bacterium]|nr:hypothetical protein [Bacillota bacterium]